MAAPEIQTRPASVARDGIAIAPFHMMYCSPASMMGSRGGVEENDQGSGSAAYVPPDPKDDVQLSYALDLLRGVKTDPAFPPNPEKAVMNAQ